MKIDALVSMYRELFLSRNAFKSIGAATIICFDTYTAGMVVHKLWIPDWAGKKSTDNIDVLNSGIWNF